MSSHVYAGNNDVKVKGCIFCESEGPLTEEHVFAHWIKRATNYESDGSRSKLIMPGVHRVSVLPVNHADRTLKILCGNCNNVWGSNIQNDASNILKPIIRGDWSKFNAKACEKLIHWIACFVMVRDFYHPEVQVISQEARKDLRLNNRIPTCLHAWTASLSDDSRNLFSHHRSGGLYPESSNQEAQNFYFTNFVVSKTVFFVFGGASNKPLIVDDIQFTSLNSFMEKLGFAKFWPDPARRSLSPGLTIEARNLDGLVQSAFDAFSEPFSWLYRNNLIITPPKI